MLIKPKANLKKTLNEYFTKIGDETLPTGSPVSKLGEAVLVKDCNAETTVITLHSHKIIVERTDKLYRTLAVLEGVLLITSSMFMISISVVSIIFALSMLNTNVLG